MRYVRIIFHNIVFPFLSYIFSTPDKLAVMTFEASPVAGILAPTDTNSTVHIALFQALYKPELTTLKYFHLCFILIAIPSTVARQDP